MSKKFQVDDKVYCPTLGNKIYRLNGTRSGTSPLHITSKEGGNFLLTENGCIHTQQGYPIVFHATPENHKKLEALYGVEFEAPEPEMVKIGNFEFPKPESEPLKENEDFYTPTVSEIFFYKSHIWEDNSTICDRMLSRGLVHKTAEAAIQHTKVLISISQGKTSF